MRIRLFGMLAAVAFASLSLAASSQTPVTRAPRARIAAEPRQQTPFTAELKVTNVKTLANGTTITKESTEVRAVDSRGRTMTSFTSVSPSGEELTLVTVYDPLERTHTSWDSGHQRATVTQMPSPGAGDSACSGVGYFKQATPQPERQTATTEDLGIEIIEGVEAHGHKTTITTPTGMMGNSEPLVRTHESWLATAIKPSVLAVRELNDNPETGRQTKELTSLTLSDPPLSTFQPPEGYEIVNHEAPASLCQAVQTAPAPTPPQ
jgi:hypothetical protein